MKRVLSIICSVMVLAILTPRAMAQNTADIWSQIDAFSEASAQENVLQSAVLAESLANVDFAKIGFTTHEAGELKVGFVDAMYRAGHYDSAAALLDSISATGRIAFETATSPEEISYYRQSLIDGLEILVEIEQARQNGNRIIDTMNIVVDLKTQQVGRNDTGLAPDLKFLAGHLEQRAFHFTRNGQASRGLTDIRSAIDLYDERSRTMDPNRQFINKLVGSANEIILKIADDYTQQNQGNQAIDFLDEQWVYLAGPWPIKAAPPAIRPLTEKRLQHYRERALFYNSIGEYDKAATDLDTALGLIVYDSSPEAVPGAGPTPFNIAYKPWAQTTLVQVLVSHTKELLARGDYETALENISVAHSLQFSPDFQGTRNDEVFRLHDRAYRLANDIPDNIQFTQTRPEPYYPTFPPVDVGGGSNYGGVSGTDVPEFETVRVFYGTNRLRRGNKLSSKVSPAIEYGWTQITVPKNRKPGELPTPGLFSQPKDGLHLVLKKTKTYSGQSDFGAKLRDSLSCGQIDYFDEDREPVCRARSNGPTEMFVFIHGHNVAFKNAALRSAQLAVDLDMRNGAVFYAWPTGRHALDYRKSRTQADESHPLLTRFLETVVRESQADQIHLIAHSMGNRILMNALNDIKAKTPDGEPPLFDHIIFGSPDVDETKFAETARAIAPLARDMTLYASDKDKALKVSSHVPGNERRAGLSPPDPRIINATEKLVVVDTSKIKRKFTDLIDHADFTAGAFNDVRAAIWTRMKPENRCVLENTKVKLDRDDDPAQFRTLTYWLAKSITQDCNMETFGQTLESTRKNFRLRRAGLTVGSANVARP